MILPDEIYRKILLDNIHDVAELLKPVIKKFNKECDEYKLYDVIGFFDYYTMIYLEEDNPKIFLKRENRIHTDWMNDAYSP
jgi:hypothetical protein